jgi:hypothetical protein
VAVDLENTDLFVLGTLRGAPPARKNIAHVITLLTIIIAHLCYGMIQPICVAEEGSE